MKRAVYEEAGVGAYWLVDPAVPSLMVLERQRGGLPLEVTTAVGAQRVSLSWPFPVTVTPQDLQPRGPRPIPGDT